jgi:hypothetical protein
VLAQSKLFPHAGMPRKQNANPDVDRREDKRALPKEATMLGRQRTVPIYSGSSCNVILQEACHRAQGANTSRGIERMAECFVIGHQNGRIGCMLNNSQIRSVPMFL